MNLTDPQLLTLLFGMLSVGATICVQIGVWKSISAQICQRLDKHEMALDNQGKMLIDQATTMAVMRNTLEHQFQLLQLHEDSDRSTFARHEREIEHLWMSVNNLLDNKLTSKD